MLQLARPALFFSEHIQAQLNFISAMKPRNHGLGRFLLICYMAASSVSSFSSCSEYSIHPPQSNFKSVVLIMILLEDVFRVEKLDPDGKKFDKVSRIEARSERFDMFMHLDVNTEIYPMGEGQKFTMALATTLNLDGTPDTGYYTPGGRKSIADKYEYIMHGKLYKISEEDPAKAAAKGKAVKAEIYVSYGGLLMLLRGDPSNMHKFDLDQRLFLCIRKL